MNIAILVDDEALNLFPDTTIAYEINSTFFDTESIPGTYSFPISLPPTPKNRRLLTFFDLLEVKGNGNSFDCKLIVDGLLLGNGTLKIRWEKDKFTGNILAQSSAFADDIQYKNLTDLEKVEALPAVTSRDTIAVFAKDCATVTYPDKDYAFPLLNNQASWKIDDLEAMQMNGFFLITSAADIISGTYTQKLIPMPYALAILTELFKSVGYTVGGSFCSNAEIRRLLVFNNYVETDSRVAQNISLKNHVPSMSYEDFINTIRKTFCLGLIFSPFKKSAEIFPLQEIINSLDYIDLTDKANPLFFIDYIDKTGYQFQFSYDENDQLQKLDTTDLLKGTVLKDSVANYAALPTGGSTADGDVRIVRNRRAYYRYYGAPYVKWHLLCYIETNQSSLNDVSKFNVLTDVADYTALIALGGIAENDVRYVIALNQYFIVRKEPGGGLLWQFLCDRIAELDIIPRQTTIQPLCAPVPAGYTIEPSGEFTEGWPYYFSAKTNQPLNDPAVTNSKPSFSLRFLFNRGVQPSTLAPYKYWQGSGNNYNVQGTKVGDYSLDWDGPDGLYNMWWKQWANFIDGHKEVQVDIAVDMNFFVSLDMKKKIRILGINYLIKRISVKFPIREPATFYLVKCN